MVFLMSKFVIFQIKIIMTKNKIIVLCFPKDNVLGKPKHTKKKV